MGNGDKMTRHFILPVEIETKQNGTDCDESCIYYETNWCNLFTKFLFVYDEKIKRCKDCLRAERLSREETNDK